METTPGSYWGRFMRARVSRRRAVVGISALFAGVASASLVGCSGDDEEEQAKATATPLPPPETARLRLSLAPCDASCMVVEPFLREEGFTEIQLLGGATVSSLTEGRADISMTFVTTLAGALEAGAPVVAIGGVHPGCVEVWAPQSVATLKDLRGRTIVVRTKAPADEANFAYPYLTIALKNAGVDPSEVNFEVQADANLPRLFLDGKSDLLIQATTGAVAFKTNPENKGHIVLDQAMEKPWSEQQCCMITTTKAWLQANPVAAKRVLRAIYRAADSLPQDRVDAARVATDKGLFGGSAQVELVRGAVNMVDYDWRKYDVADSMRFHAKLMNAAGLLKLAPEELVAKGSDLRFTKELIAELKR